MRAVDVTSVRFCDQSSFGSLRPDVPSVLTHAIRDPIDTTSKCPHTRAWLDVGLNGRTCRTAESNSEVFHRDLPSASYPISTRRV